MQYFISVLVIVSVSILGLFWLFGTEDMPTTVDIADTMDETPAVATTVQLSDEGEEFVVRDSAGNTVYTYSIDAFNAWTTEFWDTTFAERPAFGDIREVSFSDFTRFDRSIGLSPDGEYVAFVVSDYAAASSLSFIGILRIHDESIELVPVSNQGDIGELVWSADSQYIAYRLDTARAQGDGLAVVNIIDRERLFVLDSEAVLEAVGDTATDWRSYLPEFSDLEWQSTNTVQFMFSDTQGERHSGQVSTDGSDVSLDGMFQ